jgi:hypothetical protein
VQVSDSNIANPGFVLSWRPKLRSAPQSAHFFLVGFYIFAKAELAQYLIADAWHRYFSLIKNTNLGRG